jgi:hypothetical protein
MYWDVGRVQLDRQTLTSALAPLLDVHFFERVFIDFGAVAWPGEIGLAPGAMYGQVASQHRERQVSDSSMLRT